MSLDNPAGWDSLPAAKKAEAWEKFRPGTFDAVWEESKKNAAVRQRIALTEMEYRHTEEATAAKHARRMDHLAIAVQIVGFVCGFGCVVIFALLAKYFVDNDAPTQALGIFGAGSASIIGMFVGARSVYQRRDVSPPVKDLAVEGGATALDVAK